MVIPPPTVLDRVLKDLFHEGISFAYSHFLLVALQYDSYFSTIVTGLLLWRLSPALLPLASIADCSICLQEWSTQILIGLSIRVLAALKAHPLVHFLLNFVYILFGLGTAIYVVCMTTGVLLVVTLCWMWSWLLIVDHTWDILLTIFSKIYFILVYSLFCFYVCMISYCISLDWVCSRSSLVLGRVAAFASYGI